MARQGPKGLLKAAPCLTEAATLLLAMIARDQEVFEFGSGGSTLWLAGIAASVISVEDDEAWYEAVKEELYTEQVELIYAKTDVMHLAIEGDKLYQVVFVDPLDQSARVRCITEAIGRVRAGGWLVADDYNFPRVKEVVDKLRSWWDVAIVEGKKIHPTRGEVVATSTAFCRRLGVLECIVH